jgi:hypothetical protein
MRAMKSAALSAPMALLLVIAFGAALLGAPAGEHAVVDRRFLAQLSRLPVGRSMTEEEGALFGRCYWEHEPEFQYLVRKHDPAAVRVAVRILAVHAVPGGCACDFGRFPAAMFGDGVGPGFWDAVAGLTPPQRARVLVVMDSLDYGEERADVPWCVERDRRLTLDGDMRREYLALVVPAPAEGASE